VTVVTVHPWATLGGGEHNTRGIAQSLAQSGLRALTFQLLSCSAAWGILSAHSAEVTQVTAVARWAASTFGDPVVLLGSSAGAPIAGTALASLPDAIGYIAISYTWGGVAMLAFGRHYRPLYGCPQPKLFLMSEKDEFTAPTTLQRHVGRVAGDNEVVIVPGIGHFELEHPAYDGYVAGRVVGWIGQLLTKAPALEGSSHAAAGDAAGDLLDHPQAEVCRR
jgi:alpha/beta superfamily hydrolase